MSKKQIASDAPVGRQPSGVSRRDFLRFRTSGKVGREDSITLESLSRQLDLNESTVRRYLDNYRDLFAGATTEPLLLDSADLARIEAIREFLKPSSHEKLMRLIKDSDYRRRYLQPLLKPTGKTDGKAPRKLAKARNSSPAAVGTFASIAGALLGGYAVMRETLREPDSSENLAAAADLLEALESLRAEIESQLERRSQTAERSLLLSSTALLISKEKNLLLRGQLCEALWKSVYTDEMPSRIALATKLPDALLYKQRILLDHDLVEFLITTAIPESFGTGKMQVVYGAPDVQYLSEGYREFFKRTPHIYSNKELFTYQEAFMSYATGRLLGSMEGTLADIRHADSWERIYFQDAIGDTFRYLEDTCSYIGSLAPPPRLGLSKFLRDKDTVDPRSAG